MPLDRVKANELLDLVVGQSAQGRELLLDKLEECWTGVTLNPEDVWLAAEAVRNSVIWDRPKSELLNRRILAESLEIAALAN